jgi:hypothetical protein
VSASEGLTWGYYQNSGPATATSLTGDLAFISNSKLYPFSLVFSGGRSWANSGEPSATFMSLGMSQVINMKRWSAVVSDSLSYLPGTPTSDLSGVPGVGDLGANPVQTGTDTGQGVLTAYSDRVGNSVSGSLQRQLTGRTSLDVFGAYGIMRFLGSSNEGLNSDSESGGGGVSHQFNARTSLGGNYSYSVFTYPVTNVSITTPGVSSQTASFQFMRQLTRRLTVSASAGPQWTSVDSGGSSQGLSAYVNASLMYSGQFTHAGFIYTRSTNSGYGVIGGALSQSESATVSRTLARVWNCSGNASYTQSSSLGTANAVSASFDTTVLEVQVSRALMRSLSAYASYTFEHQPGGSAAAVDVFSGTEQVVGFGLTFSPTSIHLGSQ